MLSAQRSSLLFAAASTLTALLLSGCGIVPDAVQQGPGASAAFSGKVFGGQQPVANSVVTVWAMQPDGSTTSLATTSSNNGGRFSFASGAYTCPSSTVPVYITAAGGDAGSGNNVNLVMAVGLGSCTAAQSATVNINEVSTVVTALALGHFFTGTIGGSATSDLFGATGANATADSLGLVAANAGIATMLDVPNGLVKASSGNRIVDSAKIYSMANALAACVNSSGQTSTSETSTNCGVLFDGVRNTDRPADTLQAAVLMAQYPYKNVAAVYNLGSPNAPFFGLSAAPNDWTVAVSYTTSAMALGINGTATTTTSASIDVDAAGRVWFPSSKSGATGVGYFDPASQTFNGPYGGGTLAHPQYVAVDNNGVVWSSDLSSGNIAGVNGSAPTTVSTFNIPLATMGPLAVDSSNYLNLSFTGAGAFSIATLNPARTLLRTYSNAFLQNPTGLATGFGIYASTSGSGTHCSLEQNSIDTSFNTLNGNYVEVSTAQNCSSGGAAIDINETATITAAGANQFCDFRESTCRTPAVTFSTPQGVAVDGDDNLWVANQTNASVSTLHGYGDGATTKYVTTSDRQYLHGTAYGSTLTTPFGIAVDASGNVWVLNAGCVTTDALNPCAPTSMTLTELYGAAAPTITPLAAQAFSQRWGQRPVN